jgi:hypothetical protein
MSSTFNLDPLHPPRLIYLNSAQARYLENDATYIWNLTEPLVKPKGHVFVISIASAEIPYSWYLINERNNRYIVDGQVYTVPIGNYNILELIEKLKGNHSTFTFSYFETTNKLTIANASSFTLENCPGFEPFLKMLGFRFDTYVGSTSYTSDSVVNLSSYNNIYLFSNITSYAMDSFAKRGSNVLAKIPVTCTSNGIIFYTNQANLKQVVNTTNLNEIKISLINNFYSPINLNYIDFTILLQVEKVKLEERDTDMMATQPIQPMQTIEPIKQKKLSKSKL